MPHAGPARRLDDARDAMDRVAALDAAFRTIAATRMHGVPILNPRLTVQAVGFAPQVGEHGAAAVGVLVTPWFMNLVRLPAGDALAVGAKGEREIGGRVFEFIGAHEDGVGGYEACSLFSPMHEFADQPAAVATARELLALLRPPLPMAAPGTDTGTSDRPRRRAGEHGATAGPIAPAVAVAAAPATAAAPAPPPATTPATSAGARPPAADAAVASRRGFLFGRGAAPRG